MVRSVFYLISLSCLSLISYAGDIAITIDDAPMEDGVIYSGTVRTLKIIESLEATQVPSVAFFCVGSNVENPDGRLRLAAYAAKGHFIANHTYSHPHLSKVGASAYVDEIRYAESILNVFSTYRKWFRYPFLDYGVGQDRKSVESYLDRSGYQKAYVTVDAFDWYMNYLVLQAINAGVSIDYNALKKTYLKVMQDCLAAYDKIGRDVLGRSPKHVLLLHENDLTALFIKDLVALLRSNGWSIISPEEAFAAGDDIMSIALKNGIKGGGHPKVRSRDYIDSVFKELKVFGSSKQ